MNSSALADRAAPSICSGRGAAFACQQHHAGDEVTSKAGSSSEGQGCASRHVPFAHLQFMADETAVTISGSHRGPCGKRDLARVLNLLARDESPVRPQIAIEVYRRDPTTYGSASRCESDYYDAQWRPR